MLVLLSILEMHGLALIPLFPALRQVSLVGMKLPIEPPNHAETPPSSGEASAGSTDKPVFGPDTLIVEAEMQVDWDTLRAYYREHGIKCLNCPAAEVETFEQGARLHKFDLTRHLEDLNRLARDHPFTTPPMGALDRLRARVVAWLLPGRGRTED